MTPIDQPVLDASPRLLAVQESAVAKLAYALEQPGAGAVLCGPPGTGKSLVLESVRRLLEAGGQRCRVVVWQSLRESRLDEWPDVLLVDSVHDAAEGELAAVIGRCWATQPRARIVLAGSGRLVTLVARDPHVERRLGLRAVLTPCSRAETRRLVAEILTVGLPTAEATASDIADTIHEITGGVPAEVDRLARLALVVATDPAAIALSPAVIERMHGRLALTAA